MPDEFESHLEKKFSEESLKEYKSIKKDFDKDSQLDKIINLLKKLLPSEQKDTKVVKKTLDEEKRLALFVVLSPEEEDLHGDIYSIDEVEKACNNFNMFCGVANLLHKEQTEKAKITQSYINPSPFETDKGVVIKEGTWLQQYYFPEGDVESDGLWELVKSGELCGASVGCKALVEELDE